MNVQCIAYFGLSIINQCIIYFFTTLSCCIIIFCGIITDYLLHFNLFVSFPLDFALTATKRKTTTPMMHRCGSKLKFKVQTLQWKQAARWLPARVSTPGNKPTWRTQQPAATAPKPRRGTRTCPPADRRPLSLCCRRTDTTNGLASWVLTASTLSLPGAHSNCGLLTSPPPPPPPPPPGPRSCLPPLCSSRRRRYSPGKC